ncbi:MAG: CoA transferase [Deltaproteobacteria bacterium]|nr:CoA transferase [Deltaproteobacteria bacterium]MBW2359458.1 CoA transferase [Deltaproteobacteria bacterium]
MQALPFATQLLAYLGADVTKVEHPEHGDTGRGATPRVVDHTGREVGATYLRNNLGKRSVGIDLKSEAGRDLVLRMASHFDVVAENFKAGSLDALGLGYADVHALAPRVIYASISGFGNLRPSPYKRWPAYGPIAEAMGGLLEPNRKGDDPPGVVPAQGLGDNATALYCIIGILSALRQRDQTGKGQHVDVAMYDSMIAMADMTPQLHSLGADASHAAAGRTAIVGAFRARDGYFVIAVFREHHFERLAKSIGKPEWVGSPEFATRDDWARNIEPIVRPAIEAWARDKTKLEAARLFAEQGIAAGPSNTGRDLVDDPHVAAHDMLIEVPIPDREPMLLAGNPIKLSSTPEGLVRSFPGLGEHTDEVLREVLALSDDEISELHSTGVIGP